MFNSIKKIAVGAFAVSALALTGCMSGGSNPTTSSSDEFGTVLVQASTSNVTSLRKPGLGKASVIELDSLFITAISNASIPDTVMVRLGVGDSGFVASVENEQNIGVVLPLRALRTWYLSVSTVDINDSTIHTGADTVESLLAGEVRVVGLDADPLFTMYKANFNFPDSIYSPTGLFGQEVLLSRIEISLDGDVVVGSSSSFAADTDYELEYDYVTADHDSVTLSVYGTLDGANAPWDSESLLYTKTVAIAALSTVTTNDVTLTWEGPVGGETDLTVSIGVVGAIDVDAETPEEVLD